MAEAVSKRTLFIRAAWLALVAVMLARWWPGDRFDLTAAFAFAPAAALAVPALLLSIFIRKGRARFAAIGVTAILCLAAFAKEQPGFIPGFRRDRPHSGKPLRILLYNVQSFSRGPKKVADVIREYDPDIVGLLEATSWGKVLPGFREEIGDDYAWTSSRNLALGSRVPLKETFRVEVPQPAKAFRTSFVWDGEPISLWLIDMPTPPLRRVAGIYDTLQGYMAAELGPVVVIGDFNTPRQSTLLARTFAEFSDVASAPDAPRYLASWPSIAPIWQIDHAFSRELVPVSFQFVGGDASDHLGVLIEVARP